MHPVGGHASWRARLPLGAGNVGVRVGLLQWVQKQENAKGVSKPVRTYSTWLVDQFLSFRSNIATIINIFAKKQTSYICVSLPMDHLLTLASLRGSRRCVSFFKTSHYRCYVCSRHRLQPLGMLPHRPSSSWTSRITIDCGTHGRLRCCSTWKLPPRAVRLD